MGESELCGRLFPFWMEDFHNVHCASALVQLGCVCVAQCISPHTCTQPQIAGK